MDAPRIRLLCVDDHSLIREGLSAVIGQESDMEVVASASCGEDAIVQYQKHRPDVVLMDLRLPGMDGFEAIHTIRRDNPNARIIVLTMYGGDEDVYRAFRAGAAAYLLKDTLSDNLVRVIHEVYSGKISVADSAAEHLARYLREPVITPREEEVLKLIAQGLRNKEIGQRLSITEDTVRAHLKSIFGKLRVHDRTAALTVAIRRGLVHID